MTNHVAFFCFKLMHSVLIISFFSHASALELPFDAKGAGGVVCCVATMVVSDLDFFNILMPVIFSFLLT
ncbi:hypothetical protein BDC45DRAFT_500650 [Circinella umbellata]|nr:hypothetical protein BDC45DRAFT_500650 [Circinella umbellata]